MMLNTLLTREMVQSLMVELSHVNWQVNQQEWQREEVLVIQEQVDIVLTEIPLEVVEEAVEKDLQRKEEEEEETDPLMTEEEDLQENAPQVRETDLQEEEIAHLQKDLAMVAEEMVRGEKEEGTLRDLLHQTEEIDHHNSKGVKSLKRERKVVTMIMTMRRKEQTTMQSHTVTTRTTERRVIMRHVERVSMSNKMTKTKCSNLASFFSEDYYTHNNHTKTNISTSLLAAATLSIVLHYHHTLYARTCI